MAYQINKTENEKKILFFFLHMHIYFGNIKTCTMFSYQFLSNESADLSGSCHIQEQSKLYVCHTWAGWETVCLPQ